MNYAREVYRNTNAGNFKIFKFKFNIPTIESCDLIEMSTYIRVTDNILSYFNIHLTQLDSTMSESISHLNKYIGIVIENSIYDMFTNIDDAYIDEYTDEYNVVSNDDIDDWLLHNGTSFRQKLYMFSKFVIQDCVSILIRETNKIISLGANIDYFNFNRDKIDFTLLTVECYITSKITIEGI